MANIKLANVVKTFGSFTAVDHISAEVKDGEFVTLLGPSGCGKTTLLNLISGFLTADDGSIFIAGKDVSKVPPEKRDTAMCFQSYALFPHLSVRENLAFGLKQLKWDSGKIASRIDELSIQLDLKAHLAKLPNQLSGGQQQRVALGRALAVRPSVVLFDEPLSNLDAKLRESVRFEIRKIQAEAKLTAIYVTHDQSEALAMSDRIFVMNAGKVEQVGAPHEIYNAPKTRFVADFIGAANILKGEVLGQTSENIWTFATEIGELSVETDREPDAKHHYLSWRPEDADLSNSKADNNLIKASINETAFQGAFTDIFATANGKQQRIHQKGAYLPNSDSIEFSIESSKIRILEPIV